MQMTDHEILSSYSQAKDQKEQIKILADLNCTSVWEMREYLVSLGAQIDGRWFQHLNPKRVGMAEKGGKNKGAAADPDARLKDLKTALADKEKEIGELQARLAWQDETLEEFRRDQIVKQCELEEQSKRIRESKEAEQKYQATIAELESKIFTLETNAAEPAEKELNFSSILEFFISDLQPMQAYLCGRLLEELYAWRSKERGVRYNVLRVLDRLMYGAEENEQ